MFDNHIIFIKDILDEENKFKTYELKNQLKCKLNFLKYFSLISMIKSKNVTNITNAEYRSHLINTNLNSKSLSKEIYNKLIPLEDLEVDSIKGSLVYELFLYEQGFPLLYSFWVNKASLFTLCICLVTVVAKQGFPILIHHLLL